MHWRFCQWVCLWTPLQEQSPEAVIPLCTKKTALYALKIGLVFGITEAITPIIGYFLGLTAEGWISTYDHWVSFILLGGLGIRLIYGAVVHQRTEVIFTKVPDGHFMKVPTNSSLATFNVQKPASSPMSATKGGLKSPLVLTMVTAIATSIDAMIVGVTLAFVNVNIWLASLMIGTATTLMASIGVYLGARLGERIGSYAGMMGGAVLIGVGVFILLSHLGVM